MWKGIEIIFAGIFAFAVIAMRITRVLNLEKWQVSIGLFVLAIILYILNVFFIRFFIRKKTPELLTDEYWELTAGRGIVPKWVSKIGLLAISAFITALVPWIIVLLKLIVISIK